MTLQEFALTHKLRAPVKDDAGDLVLPGKLGDICEYDDDGKTFLVTFMGSGKSAQGWNTTKRALTEAGLTLHQDGDWEGSFLLTDPGSKRQAIAARRCLKVPLRRVLSPEHKAKLLSAGQKNHFSAA